MTHLLPPIPDHDAFLRVHRAAVDFWRPAIQTIAQRHDFTGHLITRFPDGDNPVFACDEAVVVKLVPPLWPEIARREIALLGSLPSDAPVSAPRLVGHGTIDDWHYLATTRLHGEGVHVLWPRLARAQQEQLARDFGAALRTLHALPSAGVFPGAFPNWNGWVRDAVANWPARRELQRVPASLRDDGPRFLSVAGLRDLHQPPNSWCRLHGDFAPVNALAAESDGTWRMSGMIDFGNASFGDPIFDYTAPTVLLQPGDAGIIQEFFAGLGRSSRTELRALRSRLMAYTLIHPMGNPGACLDLIPATRACATWDEVAPLFWPDPS